MSCRATASGFRPEPLGLGRVDPDHQVRVAARTLLFTSLMPRPLPFFSSISPTSSARLAQLVLVRAEQLDLDRLVGPGQVVQLVLP